MTRRVAVIGAGPSGLCTLRHFSKYPGEFDIVGFEKNDDIGGLWNYSDDTETDKYGLPSYASMYTTLKINLPKEQMAYPGYAFPSDLPSFCHYTDVKKYLDDFADHFDVKKLVKLNTYVTEIKPIEESGKATRWNITVRDLVTDKITSSEFDIVVICNGTEGLPIWPDIPGEKTFQGPVLHSKNFRDPKDYKDKVILMLGASYSAGDILLEVSPFVSKLYVAHRRPKPLEYKTPDNVEEVPCILEIQPDGAILTDGRKVKCDVIIYATGYNYNFPFLTPECGLTWEGNRVKPIYRHTFNIKYPTMCFVGLIKQVLEFQIAHMQALYVRGAYRGEYQLPNEQQMLADEEADYQKRIVACNLPDIKTHDLYGPPQWEYIDKISDEGKFPSLTPVNIKLFDYLCTLYDYEFDNLKTRNFRLLNDEEYEEY